MRKRSEISIEPDAPVADVLSFFAGQEPRTAQGSLRLAQALKNIGRNTDAVAEMRRGWRSF
ncbi:MAG: hypothetical protein ACPGRD_07450, partial [Planktomarina sp.]